MTNFNDVMTDLALALISLHSATNRKTISLDDALEIRDDIQKLYPQLSEKEREDLVPEIKSLIDRLFDDHD